MGLRHSGLKTSLTRYVIAEYASPTMLMKKPRRTACHLTRCWAAFFKVK